MHYQKRNKLVKQWKDASEIAYVEKKFGRIPPSLIRVEIPFTVVRRRDPHNYCGTIVKSIVDGLVHAGAWPDDTPDFVNHIEPELFIGELVTVKLWDKSSSLLEISSVAFLTDPQVDV